MFKQMFSCRKVIKTCKKPKRKEKIELKFAIWQKQVKAKIPAENSDI